MCVSTCLCITPALRNAVHRIMFQSRRNSLVLNAVYHLDSEFRNVIWLLSIALQHPSPSRITRHIQDWRIYIGITQHLSLLSYNFSCLIDKILVPCASDSYRSRKRSRHGMVKAMDSFIGKVYRYTEPCLLDKPSLHSIFGLDMILKRVNQLGMSPGHLAHTI